MRSFRRRAPVSGSPITQPLIAPISARPQLAAVAAAAAVVPQERGMRATRRYVAVRTPVSQSDRFGALTGGLMYVPETLTSDRLSRRERRHKVTVSWEP